MRILRCLTFCVASIPCLAQSIPTDTAADVFRTAAALNARDHSRMWGMPVCGPILLVDPQSHAAAANQADANAKLQKSGDVWIGNLPKDVIVANTATSWSGVRWTMMMWPLTDQLRDRAELIGHECFHRIQPDLKLTVKDSANSHLDSKDGRTWLQLEWRALERALASTGTERQKAIVDALLFRRHRRALMHNVADAENQLEINEGLAEYTGMYLANANEADRRASAISALHRGPRRPSFGRSFAYVSGPAYGVLLDAAGIPWRKQLTAASDLGDLTARAYKIPKAVPGDSEVMAAVARYDGEALIAFENARDLRMQKELAELRAKFIDGPVLLLPIGKTFSYGFDPNDIVSLDSSSTVYRNANVSDDWGTLDAAGGVLLVRQSENVVRVAVPAGKDAASSEIAGPGWKLTLKPGWRIVSGERAGDQRLSKGD